MIQDSGAAHCAAEVRSFDRERWLFTFLAPRSARAHLNALYAFNLEIARIREVVSDPMLGQIRLQWWREAIDGITAGEPRDHPVVAALEHALGQTGLEPTDLMALVDGREADLAEEGPAEWGAFEAYCRATGGALNRAALDVLGVVEPRAADAGELIGTAWAMTGHLRNVAWLAAHGRVALPADLLARHGVARDDLLACRSTQGLCFVAETVAAAARNQITAARAHAFPAPKAAHAVLGQARICEATLNRISEFGFELFHARLALAPIAAPLAVARVGLTGNF
jgi:phytoene synthase